jgi:hypothetical protein
VCRSSAWVKVAAAQCGEFAVAQAGEGSDRWDATVKHQPGPDTAGYRDVGLHLMCEGFASG